jgi:hypothetical protein
MTKKVTLSNTEQVTAHIQKLDAAIIPAIEALRQIILSADPEIGEQVKWNSPSFYYTGEMKPFDPKEYKRDIVVMNLHRGHILLVFPTGARVQDTAKLMEGNYTDGRKLIRLKDLEDVKKKKDALINVLRAWLALVEK